MELLSQFYLSPYRIYKVSKRTNKGIAAFPQKPTNDHLDYSIDFSRRLEVDERVLSGGLVINGSGLKVDAVVPNGNYLTAFLSGGKSNYNYYLVYTAQTNLGNVFIQEMVLPTVGKLKEVRCSYKYYTLSGVSDPPITAPPLNAIKINDRYLLNDSGFFMVV